VIPYAHVHTHSEFSALDGLSTCTEIAERAAMLGHSRVAVTDHGTCASHMDFQRACDAAGVAPVFGLEAYFCDDRKRRGLAGDRADQKEALSYTHLVLLAMDEQGLHDLWALSTESHRDSYGKARVDWDLLERFGGHLIATSACLGGVASELLLSGRRAEGESRLKRMHEIFGDRFYLEVQGNGLGQQIQLNQMLADFSYMHGVPLIAASDAHYPSPADARSQELWLTCRTGGRDDDYWHFIHMQDADETLMGLEHLGQGHARSAIENAAVAAGRCDARITGMIAPPVFTGSAREDGELLLSLCMRNWDRTRGRSHGQREYIERFEREMDLLIRAGYCGYYDIVADYCSAARGEGILVGPGRGSGAGSLVAYQSGITGIDPMEHGLMFERFLTEGRIGKSLPDFDVDFPASRRPWLQDYVIGKYGEERVVRVGSHTRYRNRGIVAKLMSVMERENDWVQARADGSAISKIIDSAEEHTAGLGLTWDQLHEQVGPLLEPYIERYPRLFDAAGHLAGRLYSYGRHASGVVLSPDVTLAGRLPLRAGDPGDPMISEFSFDDLEWLGLVKFDFLTLRTLDTLQAVTDTVRTLRGHDQRMEDWGEQYEDPLVWDLIGTGRTMGMFQLETTLCSRMCATMQPRSLADLAALNALIRPGPRNSGITKMFLDRRAGREEVSYQHPLLEEALAGTFGTMIYQEDILRTCQVLAGYTLAEADDVRKILGKKKVELVEKEGQRFMAGCEAAGIPPAVAKGVWAEMAEFARYGFNRSHSFSYAVLGYWTAWFKAHYPVEFYTALLTTVPKDRCPVIIREAQAAGIAVLPPDINESGAGFRPGPLQVRYGLHSIKGIGDVAVEQLLAARPFADWEDFDGRRGSAVHSGVVLLLARCGALDSLVPSRSALVARLEYEQLDLGSKDCAHYGAVQAHQIGPAPCSFDWAAEPPPVSERTGKPLKGRPPPKKCTRACRRYSPPDEPDWDALDSYTPAQVRELELDTLGTWLSSTPFDDLGEDDREYLREQAHAARTGQPGVYRVSAIIRAVRLRTTRTGMPIAFVTLEPEDGEAIETAVFADQLHRFRPVLEEGRMILAKIGKTYRDGPEGPEPAYSLEIAVGL
jgi:DNA polymerase III subunit alpha